MRFSVSLLTLALGASAVLAQSASTSPKTPPATSSPGTPAMAPASPGLQPRGPEAVAKQQPDKVVATINGKQITAKEANDLINTIPVQDRARLGNNLAQILQQIYTED